MSKSRVDNSIIKSDCSDLDDISKVKSRNYTYFAYPDSMPEDLFNILKSDSDNSQKSSNPYSVIISPLHDSDVDDFGKPKKPHYHIVTCHKNEIFYNPAKKWGSFRGLVMCEKVFNKVGMLRYLCHLDNPDKFKYNPEDVIAYNLDYKVSIGSVEDKIETYKVLLDLVNEHDILYFNDLIDYVRLNNDDLFRFCMTQGTYNIEKYVRHRCESRKDMLRYSFSVS